MSAYAYEEALVHFERGLAAKEDRPTDEETAALLFGLARVQEAIVERHRFQEVADLLKRAFDFYAECGDLDRAVAIAEYPLSLLGGQNVGLDELISRAIALVPSDSHTAGRLLSRYVRVIGIERGNYEEAQEALSRALAIAQRARDHQLELQALSNAIQVDEFYYNLREAITKGLRVFELARHVDDPHSEVVAHFYTAWTQIAVGDPGGARLRLEPLAALADRLRHRSWLSNANLTHSYLSQLEVEWQAARNYSDRGLAVLPMEPRLLGFRELLEYGVGDFSQGEVFLQRLLEVVRIMPPGATMAYGLTSLLIPLASRAAEADLSLAVAEEAAQIILSLATATQLVATQARSGLALLAISSGDLVLQRRV